MLHIYNKIKLSPQDYYKIYVFITHKSHQSLMNYLNNLTKMAGNINATIGNTLAGTTNSTNNTTKQKQKQQIAQLERQLKRKDKSIKEFEAQVKKLMEDNQFINKAFEEIEIENRDIKGMYKKIQGVLGNWVGGVKEVTTKLETQMKAKIQETLLNKLEAQLGQRLQQPQQQQNTQHPRNPINLSITLDCSQYLQSHYTSLITTIKQQLSSLSNRKSEQQFQHLQAQFQQTQTKFKEELEKTQKEYKSKIYELQQVRINNEQEFQEKLRDLKENSDIVIGQLKNMLTKQKQNSAKNQKQFNSLKISQDKYQKAIYTKCQQNNQLIAKNKEIMGEIELLRVQVEDVEARNKKLEEGLRESQGRAEELVRIVEEGKGNDVSQEIVKDLREEVKRLRAAMETEKSKVDQKQAQVDKIRQLLNKVQTQLSKTRQQLTTLPKTLTSFSIEESSQTFLQNLSTLLIKISENAVIFNNIYLLQQLKLQEKQLMERFVGKLGQSDGMERMDMLRERLSRIQRELKRVRDRVGEKENSLAALRLKNSQLEQKIQEISKQYTAKLHQIRQQTQTSLLNQQQQQNQQEQQKQLHNQQQLISMTQENQQLKQQIDNKRQTNLQLEDKVSELEKQLEGKNYVIGELEVKIKEMESMRLITQQVKENEIVEQLRQPQPQPQKKQQSKESQKQQITGWLQQKIAQITSPQPPISSMPMSQQQPKLAQLENSQNSSSGNNNSKESQYSELNPSVLEKFSKEVEQLRIEKMQDKEEYDQIVTELRENLEGYVRRIGELEGEMKDMQKVGAHEETGMGQAKGDEERQKEIRQLKERLEEISKQGQQNIRLYKDCHEQLQTTRHDLQSKKTQLEQFTQTIQQHKKIQTQLRTSLTTKQQQLSIQTQKLTQSLQQIQQLRLQLQQQIQKAGVNYQEKQEKYGELEAKVQEIEGVLRRKEEEIQRIGKERDQTQRKLQNSQRDLSNQIEKVKNQAEQIQKLTQQQKALSQNLDNSSKSYNQLQQTMQTTQHQLSTLTTSHQQTLQSLHNLSTQLKQTQQQKQQMRGDLQMMKEMTASLDEQYLELEKMKGKVQEFEKLREEFSRVLGKEMDGDGFGEIVKEREMLHEAVLKLKKDIEIKKEVISEVNQVKAKAEEEQKRLLQEIYQLKTQNKMLSGDLQQKQRRLTEMETNYIQQGKAQEGFIQKLNADLIALQNEIPTLRKQLQQQRKKNQSLTTELTQKQKQLTNTKTKKAQTEQTSKKQSQSYKNKYNKLQTQFSQAITQQKQLKQKLTKYEGIINDYRKAQAEWKTEKQNLNKKDTSRQEEIAKMRLEVERVVIETADKMKKERMAMQSQMVDREEVFKMDKVALEKKYAQELDKMKTELVRKDFKIQEAQNQTKATKNKLMQEKKAAGLLTAKIQQMKSDFAKMDSVEAQSLQLRKKLLMKDQQIKKAFKTVSNLKSTMQELETGIQTYQAYAQEKSQEVEQSNNKMEELKQEIKQLKQENKGFKEKFNLQVQFDEAHSNNQNGKTVEPKKVLDRKQIILPLKRLILKYFDSGATYEQKANTLSTLSQVLELDKKQSQILKGYKRAKLLAGETESKQKKQKQPGIQNKFFQFLTSDK